MLPTTLQNEIPNRTFADAPTTNYVLVSGATGVGKSLFIEEWTARLEKHRYSTVSPRYYGGACRLDEALKEDFFKRAEQETSGERYCFIEVVCLGPMEITFQDFFGAEDLHFGLAGEASDNAVGLARESLVFEEDE